jgi:hypothetical protein
MHETLPPKSQFYVTSSLALAELVSVLLAADTVLTRPPV